MNPKFGDGTTVLIVGTGEVGKVVGFQYLPLSNQYKYYIALSEGFNNTMWGKNVLESELASIYTKPSSEQNVEYETLLNVVKLLPTTIRRGDGWGKEWNAADCVAFYSAARRMRRAGISFAEIEYLLTRMYKEVVEEEARQNKETE